MKKAFSLILALTLVFAMAVPALATNPTGGSTNVTYTVGNSYTITIPETVTITNGTGTQEVKVNENSIIPADKNLTFSITGATNYDTENSKFRMINDVGTNVYLDYSINNGGTSVTKGTAFLTASATEAYAGKSVTLTYTTDTATSAGTYSDTLTFAVALTS